MRYSLGNFVPELSKGFGCLDCGVDTNKNEEYYMLRDGLWRSIVRDVDGMLCINCAEKRLGRRLTFRDFARLPINLRQAALSANLSIRLNDFRQLRFRRSSSARKRRNGWHSS